MHFRFELFIIKYLKFMFINVLISYDLFCIVFYVEGFPLFSNYFCDYVP